MPTRTGKDSTGCFAQWGSQKKYYFTCGDEAAKTRAVAKANAQGKAIRTAQTKNSEGRMDQMLYQVITYNLKPVVRYEKMAGQDFVVVPMVMMVEGVLNGSKGPIYYPASEMRKLPVIWNNKPVVVYHPSPSKDFGSACTPAELTVRQIGVIMNTQYEPGKLRAEAWLYPNRIDEVDDRVAAAIKNQLMLELSTGLYVDVEMKNGTFKNKAYVGIARNFRPDHLAVLPDLKGACSVEEGAGFIRLNQAAGEEQAADNADPSYSDVRKALEKLVYQKGFDTWVVDVWDDKFVYERSSKVYEQEYALKDGVPSLVGLPTEVVRVTTYEPAKNESNSVKGTQMANKKNDVKATVDAIIENESTPWTEEDRETLMGLDEKVLNKLAPVETEDDKNKVTVVKDDKAAVANAAKDGAKDLKPETKPEVKPVTNAVAVQSLDEFINNAPAELQPVLRHGISTYNAEHAELVDAIMKNKRNTFTKEYLNARDSAELQAILNFAGSDESDENEDSRFTRTLNFSGQAPVKNSKVGDEEPLVAPTMNFKKA